MPWLVAAGIYLYTSCSHEETFKLKDVVYDNGSYTCLYESYGKYMSTPKSWGESCKSQITVCLDKK